MGEWIETTLGEVVELKRGYDLPQQNRRAGRVPIVSSSGFTDRHDTPMVKGPGVVTGRYGTLGQVFYVSQDFWPLNTTLYVRDFKGNDPRFVSYFLRSLDFFAYSDKAAVPGLNRNHLHQAPVIFPKDQAEQRAIATALGVLDDKIDLNRRMSDTLEAIAGAIFGHWLKSISPPRKKCDQWINESVMEIGDGYRAKNDELGGSGLPFVRAADLNGDFDTATADKLQLRSVAKVGNKISRAGDIAFTSKGTIGRFAQVGADTETFVYSPQVCFWRSLDHKKMHPALLYCWMQTNEFGSQVASVSSQTDMAPYVSLRDQRQFLVPLLAAPELGDRIELLLQRKSVGRAEARLLAHMRDTLLPKLISGELRIKDAERFVGAAV